MRFTGPMYLRSYAKLTRTGSRYYADLTFKIALSAMVRIPRRGRPCVATSPSIYGEA